MSEADPHRPPYLRRITFLDPEPDEGTDLPVHLAQSVLLDGVEQPGLVVREGWQVFSDGPHEPTLVSFCVPADRAELGKPVESEGLTLIEGRALCGIPVLTPRDHPWHLLRGMDGEPDLVRVYVFVREVEVIAAKVPA